MAATAEPSVNTLTIVLALWGAIGPLVALFVGAYLTRSGQRKQWLADERVKEWRELLTTLTTSLSTIVSCSSLPKTPERLADDLHARVIAGVVINSRLFIGHEISKGEMVKQWREAVKKFDEDHDEEAFGASLANIQSHIERGARKDIGKV